MWQTSDTISGSDWGDAPSAGSDILGSLWNVAAGVFDKALDFRSSEVQIELAREQSRRETALANRTAPSTSFAPGLSMTTIAMIGAVGLGLVLVLRK